MELCKNILVFGATVLNSLTFLAIKNSLHAVACWVAEKPE